MSIFKDWHEDTRGYRLDYKAAQLVSPKQWTRLVKWRRQRANRGWADRDAWGAGEHIAKITAEMLQHLIDKGVCDWPEWFKLNVKEEGKGAYKNLQQVVDDINNFLQFTETSWADGLYCDTSHTKQKDGEIELKQKWYDEKTNKLQTEPAIKHRINKWSKEYERLYKKATKAMQFFGRHFGSFWD